MTDHEKPPVRLSPPPKIGGSPRSGTSDGPLRSGRGALYWLTLIAFLALGATAVAVFVFLPNWIEAPDPTPLPVPAQAEATAIPPASDSPVASAGTEATDEPKHAPEQPLREAPTVAPPVSRPTPPPKKADPGEEAFGQAMTVGLSRLAEGDLIAAERAFGQALSLRPGSSEAADGLAQVEAEQMLQAIADHQERAASLEEQERWSEAEREYAAVMALDPTIRFAQDGRLRAAARASLSQRLDAHLAHPDRLASDAVLEDAHTVLEEALAIDQRGPLLSRQMERMTTLIRTAETPIKVVLLSDDRTEILVFRVGRLGSFERHELELRPGTYTVVGTRDGYRDVRRTLEVSPGNDPVELTVRCEEKI